MRPLPEAMQASLDSGATTLCRCWRIDPRGASLGFTDHDEDIVFGGVTFEAASGFTGTAIERSLGLAIDNMTASGALQSERIAAGDIDAGRYDGAAVRLWLVNWRSPDQRHLLFSGEVGEITLRENGYEVELRGLSEPLNRPVGRRYNRACDAEVGDLRCGFDVSKPGFLAEGSVGEVISSRKFTALGLSAFANGWFSDGVLTWESGRFAGTKLRVGAHRSFGEAAILELPEDQPEGASPGDTFSIVAGCDKSSGICRSKFDNILNFRGFPHIPGDGWITAHPVEGEVHDGGRHGGSS